MTSTVSSCSRRCGLPAVGHEVVDQHAEPSARCGAGLGDLAGQVVDPCSGSTTTPSTRRSCSYTRSTSSASRNALHLQQAVPHGAGGVAGGAGRVRTRTLRAASEPPRLGHHLGHGAGQMVT